MKIYKNISELIGNTPLFEPTNYAKDNALRATVLCKLEYLNPAGSVKDRAALGMIEAAEADGNLKEGSVIIEPTSGNTGIGLAAIAAYKGYKVILTMPETMSVERRKLLAAYGAEIVLTEGSKGMQGAVEKANELLKEAGAKRAVLLPVSAPFHSTLMAPAAQKLAVELDKITINDAQIPVVANVTGKMVTDAKQIRDLLVTQADHPVMWEDCVAEMVAFGADTFVESGPGKVLTGLTKKIIKGMNLLNVENADSLEKTLAYFKEVR